MDWNQITALPCFWVPFKSLPFTLLAVIAVPTLLAFIIGFAMFKRRVGGVYFAIITQAVALILTVLIIGQQGYTGGVNGMTDLKTLLGWDIRTDSAKYILYFVMRRRCCSAASCCAAGSRRSKLGTLLLAMRDKEDRVRFSGYDVANFKIFVFCLAAALSGIGGAMFTLQVGFMSPSLRRHRAVDRDGDLRRRRRAHVAGRRGLRHAAGELRQDLLLRELPGPVAVPDGRAVHRRDAWPSRRAWPACGRATSSPGGKRRAAAAQAHAVQPAAGARRRPAPRRSARRAADAARCPTASAASSA